MSAHRGRLSFLRLSAVRFCLVAAAAFAVVLCCATPVLHAQTSNTSLSGEIRDTTGATIPGAKAVLVNQSSRDARTTLANKSGVFNFSGVEAGTYTLTVTYKGFETYKEKDIALHPGDNTQLPGIALIVGAENITIEVSAHDEIATDGEVSSLITSEDIKHLATEGRDVTELVKILPGFALQPGGASNGGLSNAAPNNEVVGPGGSLGNYAANGTTSSGINLTSDGANVTDPGAGGATTQTINMDMVEEVKVSTSNFGADSAHGPVVINAVGKSGGQQYHGTLYLIARTYQLNSQDWLLKNQGEPKPQDRYLYPGFTIGGPVRIPGTNFNHNKKLQFLIGAEDYIQRNAFLGGNGAAALKLSTVPTDAMRGGDFSQSSVASLFNVPYSDLLTNCSNVTGATLSVFQNFCKALPDGSLTPNHNIVAGGKFPVGDIDPGAAVYLNKLFPHQNRLAQAVLGTTQESDGFDRIDVYLTNYDLYQARGRIDYSFSPSSKFFAVYNVERGYSYSPFTLYGNLSYTSGVLRDPSLIKSGVNSQTASVNFVHIFSPTLTAETFGAGSYYFNSFNPKDESTQTAAALGYPYANLYNTGSKQIPQLSYGNNSGIPLYAGPDFSFGQSFSRKLSLDAGENVTKVYRQHTIKVGFFYERISNDQLTASGPTQGALDIYGNYGCFKSPGFDPTGLTCNNTTAIGNTMVDFLYGYENYYSVQTQNVVEDLYYNTVDGFVTDTWKATRNLSLDLGVRFDHLGPWVDPHNVGPAFWYPQKYAAPSGVYGVACSATGTPVGCAPGITLANFPGISWHGKDNSVSDAVGVGRWAFVSPRLGFAWNAYGNGRTVFKGGAGYYRSHDSWNNYVGALGTALGSISVYQTNISLACADTVGRGTAATTPACATFAQPNSSKNYIASNNPSITVADPTDNQQPLTFTYSFGVDQAIKRFGNLNVNYVGNRSNHLLLSGGYAGNINTIKQGGLFAPDPNPQSPGYGVIVPAPDNIGNAATNTLVDDYRPFPFYNGINLIRHQLHTNYNSLQTSLVKYTGKFRYNLNYTWSKALGETNGPDGTNYRNDYGILAFDRTNAFNASYTYIEGRPFHVNKFLSAFINGYEISGITNLQSGPNIPASYGRNFQLSVIGTVPAIVAGGGAAPINTAPPPTDSTTYLGTPDISLQPLTTCDPSTRLHSGQFINASCLTLGPVGVNGPFHYPYLRGPAFFNSDLTAQKSFALGGKKELTFRYAAFNFLNHPLTSLVAATASPLKLVINGPGGSANGAFGISDYKEGRRVSEVTMRFNF